MQEKLRNYNVVLAIFTLVFMEKHYRYLKMIEKCSLVGWNVHLEVLWSRAFEQK